MGHFHLARGIFKPLPPQCMNGLLARVALPAADGDVNIARIKFKPIADSTCSFGRDQRASLSQKRIENQIAPCRAIQDGVSHKSHRLYCGVESEEIPFIALLL